MADFDKIATFVHLVRGNSLAAAGRHLGVPKSTISRRLARLEQQLATKLVHRDARRLSLTPEGQRFFEAVTGAVDDLEGAVSSIQDSAIEARGNISVTAPNDLGRLVMMPHFIKFLERYPQITLDIILTNRFVDLVQEGVDLAIRAGQVTEPNLIARQLFPSRLKLATSPEMVLPQDEILTLARWPFVLFRARRRTAQVIRLQREGDGGPETVELQISGRVNVDDYSAMIELVAAGHGVGLMPDLHLKDAERAGRLRAVFSDWYVASSHVNLVYTTKQLPARVRLLIDFLIDTLRTTVG